MSVRKYTIMLVVVFSLLFASKAYAVVDYIKPNEHPNLYFNSSEINAIKKAVLVDRSPAYAVESWNKIKDARPIGKPANIDTLPWSQNYAAAIPATKANFEATLSYLIEPSDEKALKLKQALLSWVTDKTNAAWVKDGQNGGHIHFALPFMYDALYNSGHLSSNDKRLAEEWFVHSTNLMLMTNEQWATRVPEETSIKINKEDTTREDYPNWFEFKIMGAAVMALASKDETSINKVFINTVPDTNYSLANFSQYNPKTRGFVNMLGGLVYPSGYNWDGYHRNYGFNAPTTPYNGERSGQGQHYHFFALMPVVLASEAVYHSGFDAFDYNNNGILRSFEIGSAWASTTYREPHSASEQPNYNWSPFYWLIYRHYPNNAKIKAEVQKNSSKSAFPYTVSDSAPLWGVLADVSGGVPTITPTPTPVPTPTLTPSPTPDVSNFDINFDGFFNIFDAIAYLKLLFSN